MKRYVPYIAAALVMIFILVLIRCSSQTVCPRLVAWTGNTESGEKCIYLYSTEEQGVVKQVPGTLLIGSNKDELLCFEYENGTVSLYTISDQLSREKVADIPLPNYSRLIGWIDGFLFYISDSTFMRASRTGECVEIAELKGENRYRTNPQPSYDGKWAYSYRDDNGYHIDILSVSGEVIDTIDGLHHVWYDTDSLLFKPTLQSRGLSRYSCMTRLSEPARDDLGKEYDVEYSLFYTCGISIDSHGEYLVYSYLKAQHFWGIQFDSPRTVVIVMMDLHNGKKIEIELPSWHTDLLWHIANVPLMR